jgi:hypothetical protein
MAHVRPEEGLVRTSIALTRRLPGEGAWTDLHDDIVAQFTGTGTGLDASVTYDPLGKVIGAAGAMMGSLGYQSEWSSRRPRRSSAGLTTGRRKPFTGRSTRRRNVSRSVANGTTWPIKDINVGDKVLATDPTTGKSRGRPGERLEPEPGQPQFQGHSRLPHAQRGRWKVLQ